MNCNTCGFYNDASVTNCKNCGAPLNNSANIFGEDILRGPAVTNMNADVSSDNSIINNNGIVKEDINVNNNIYNKEENVTTDVTPNNVEPIGNLNSNVTNTTVMNDNNVNNDEKIVNDDNNIMTSNLNPFGASLNIDNNSNNKKSNSEPLDMKKTLIIVGGIVLASLIILISVIIGTKASKNKYSGNTSKVVNDDYRISFSGYDITIPKGIAYEISGSSLVIKEKDEKWITIIEVSDFNYSKLVVNKDTIKKSYEGLNMKVGNMVEKTYQGVTYLTSEMIKNNVELVLGITKASQTQSFVVISFKPDYKLSYDGLNNVASILKTAEYTGVNKRTDIKSDFFDFSKITG